MTDTLLNLIPVYGPWLMLLVTFLSCLALPMPASIVMLTAGGLAASGDLAVWSVALMAFLGAVLGDQSGFAIGRMGERRLMGQLARNPGKAALVDRANGLIATYGLWGVFLSRWLFSPLGPWLNFAGGAAGMRWIIFTPAAIAGEAVWVVTYVGLGYVFANKIVQMAQIGGTLSVLLAALAVTLGLGALLRKLWYDRQSEDSTAEPA